MKRIKKYNKINSVVFALLFLLCATFGIFGANRFSVKKVSADGEESSSLVLTSFVLDSNRNLPSSVTAVSPLHFIFVVENNSDSPGTSRVCARTDEFETPAYYAGGELSNQDGPLGVVFTVGANETAIIEIIYSTNVIELFLWSGGSSSGDCSFARLYYVTGAEGLLYPNYPAEVTGVEDPSGSDVPVSDSSSDSSSSVEPVSSEYDSASTVTSSDEFISEESSGSFTETSSYSAVSSSKRTRTVSTVTNNSDDIVLSMVFGVLLVAGVFALLIWLLKGKRR